MLHLQNEKEELQLTLVTSETPKILTLPRQKQTALSKHGHELDETKLHITT